MPVDKVKQLRNRLDILYFRHVCDLSGDECSICEYNKRCSERDDMVNDILISLKNEGFISKEDCQRMQREI